MSRKPRKKQQVEDVKSNDLFAYHGPDPFKKHKEVEVTIEDVPEEDHNLKKDVVKTTTFEKYDLESWKGIRQQQADDKTVEIQEFKELMKNYFGKILYQHFCYWIMVFNKK